MAKKNELGTIEVGEWGFGQHGKHQRWEEDFEEFHGTKSPLISVRCGLGRIVASIAGDAGIYDDVSIDLVTDDGRHLQLATVTCSEGCEETGDDPTIKVLAWDGMHEFCVHEQEVTVDEEESYWW
ncbi:MAG: hypothetical protein IKF14_13305 [Atopobiaceae bacterium]|nr:hypothetical protein [Atopobiaceae bacterium]